MQQKNSVIKKCFTQECDLTYTGQNIASAVCISTYVTVKRSRSDSNEMAGKPVEGGSMKKRVVAWMMAALMATFCMAGCGAKETAQNAGSTAETKATVDTQAEETETTVDTQAEETETTADTKAAETETVQEKNDTDAAILVVSFGTSYNDSRDLTIGAIEEAIAEAFPEYDVRRAFTSQIIIDILKDREGLEIDNVEEALDRAVADGIKTLVVQPTHLMNGFEYTDLVDALADYEDQFEQIAIASPLLTEDADYDAVIDVITEKMASYDDGETAIVFMGHGTEADSNVIYETLQNKITAAGYENYYIGTVEAEPSLDDVIAALKENGNYKKVVLEPLMVVAGDHANNDMAGDEEDSWKTILTNEGYEVECVLEGLGQIPAIQDIYVAHTKAAVDGLTK